MIADHEGHRSRVLHLPVLGVMTSFDASSAAVAAAIYDCYGAWTALSPDLISASAAAVRIVEHEGHATAVPTFRHRVADRTTLLISGDDLIGVADARRRAAIAYIPRGLTAHTAVFRDGVLEPLTLFLLGDLDRQPLHAAAIMRHGAAIVLAGPSGTGKSTLAYAARARGFSILADEPVYVQLEPALRIWGRRPRVHLTEDARAHFPELRTIAASALPSGKTKIIIEDDDFGVRYAERVAICVLHRGDAKTPQLARIPPAEAVSQLTNQLDPGYDVFAPTIGDRIARIAEQGAWSLSLTTSPADALPMLDRIATEMERAA